MAKAHFVAKARKDNSAVKKGESYWWWQFRHGGKRYSATKPRASQLTQSEYKSQFYALQEEFEDYKLTDRACIEAFKDFVEELADRVRELGSEQEEKRDNMPEQLQDSESGELLQRRAEACENLGQELEELQSKVEDLLSTFDDEHPKPDLDDKESEGAKALEALIEQVQDEASSLAWDEEA